MAETAGELDRLIDGWFEGELERDWRLLDGFARALHPAEADRDERRAMDRRFYTEDAERTLERLTAEYARRQFHAGAPGASAIAAGLATPLPEDGPATSPCSASG